MVSFRRLLALFVICLTFAAMAFAQAEGQEAAAPAAKQRPFVKAVLTASNVNVRSGPGTEYPVYYGAPMGAEVQVVGRKGQWLEIEFPAKEFSYVSKDYLTKIDESTAVITGSNVNVRLGPGIQFDRVYVVQAGHKFKVLSADLSGQWYQVAPMPDAAAWIMVDYVRLSGPIPGEEPAPPPSPEPVTPTATEPAPTPQPVAPGVYEAKMAEAEKAFAAETQKEDPTEWDLTKIEEIYADIEANANDPMLLVRARKKLAQVRAYVAIKERAVALGKVDEGLTSKLAALEKQRQEEISAAAAGGTAPYIATGKLEKFYISGLGGATHKLVQNGKIVYLLRSEVLNFSSYEGKTCGVRGRIVAIPGIMVQIIEATNATVIPEKTG